MPHGFVVALALLVAVILGSRFLLASLPLRRVSVPMSATDAVVAGIGVLGLVLHCSAMFFPSLVAGLPGSGGVIDEVNALGTVSIIGYVVPAVLVLVGLRRQHRVALAVVALALTAVGITMYDGGSLDAHLGAIFVSVVVLAGIVAGLVIPPWRHTPAVVGR